MSPAAAATRRTLVVGIGQPLGGDDAVGLAVADRLRTLGIPARAAADGAALVDLLASAECALIIDAVVGAGPPGAVLHLRGDDLTARGAAFPVSSHALSVPDALAIARALGGAAETHLIGIAIEPPTGLSSSLSPAVAAAVETAALRVRELLRERCASMWPPRGA